MVAAAQQLSVVPAHCTAPHQQLAVVAVTAPTSSTAAQQLTIITTATGTAVSTAGSAQQTAVVRRHAVHVRTAGQLAVGVARVEERVVGVVVGMMVGGAEQAAATATLQFELV